MKVQTGSGHQGGTPQGSEALGTEQGLELGLSQLSSGCAVAALAVQRVGPAQVNEVIWVK